MTETATERKNKSNEIAKMIQKEISFENEKILGYGIDWLSIVLPTRVKYEKYVRKMTEKAVETIAKKLKYKINNYIWKDVAGGTEKEIAEVKYKKIYKLAMNGIWYSDIDKVLVGLPDPHMSTEKIMEEIEQEYIEVARKVEEMARESIYEYFRSFVDVEKHRKLRLFVEKTVSDIFEPKKFAKQYIKQEFWVWTMISQMVKIAEMKQNKYKIETVWGKGGVYDIYISFVDPILKEEHKILNVHAIQNGINYAWNVSFYGMFFRLEALWKIEEVAEVMRKYMHHIQIEDVQRVDVYKDVETKKIYNIQKVIGKAKVREDKYESEIQVGKEKVIGKTNTVLFERGGTKIRQYSTAIEKMKSGKYDYYAEYRDVEKIENVRRIEMELWMAPAKIREMKWNNIGKILEEVRNKTNTVATGLATLVWIFFGLDFQPKNEVEFWNENAVVVQGLYSYANTKPATKIKLNTKIYDMDMMKRVAMGLIWALYIEGVTKEDMLDFTNKAWKRHRAQTLLGVMQKIWKEEIVKIKWVWVIWQAGTEAREEYERMVEDMWKQYIEKKEYAERELGKKDIQKKIQKIEEEKRRAREIAIQAIEEKEELESRYIQAITNPIAEYRKGDIVAQKIVEMRSFNDKLQETLYDVIFDFVNDPEKQIEAIQKVPQWKDTI